MSGNDHHSVKGTVDSPIITCNQTKYCTETINPSTPATTVIINSSSGYIDFGSFLGLVTSATLLLILLAVSVTMNFIVLVTKLRYCPNLDISL